MPTSTYTPIATTTLVSAQTSVTFSTGLSGYTDLYLIVSGKSDGANADFGLRFNGDTGTNYSRLYLYGSGSTLTSGVTSNSGYMNLMNFSNVQTEVNRVHIMNYSNSTTYKTCLSRVDDAASLGTVAQAGLWRSTAAITSLSIVTGGVSALQVGTMLTLYGIKAA